MFSIKRIVFVSVAATLFIGGACHTNTGPRQPCDSTCSAKLTQTNKKLSKTSTKLSKANDKLSKANDKLSNANNRLTNVNEQLSSVNEQLSQANQEIETLDMQRQQSEAASSQQRERSEQLARIVKNIRSAFAPSSLDVEIRNGMAVLVFPDEILFESGKFTITPQGEDVLYGAVRVLQETPDIEDQTFVVAGHTDNRPVKPGTQEFSSNLELSALRSIEVVQFLSDKGVPSKLLGAAGFGDQRPMASNDTREGRSKNRRTEIVIFPNFDALPTIPPDSPDAVSVRE